MSFNQVFFYHIGLPKDVTMVVRHIKVIIVMLNIINKQVMVIAKMKNGK